MSRAERKNMSVLKRFQSKSDVEFMNTAHELEKFTILAVKQIPKTYTFTLKVPLCESARKINQYIRYANSIYPVRNRDDFEALKEMRRNYQRLARIELENFFELLRITSEIVPLKNLETWVGYAVREIDLLKSWVESDKSRYK